jgi:uncharacterized protein (TIGR02145 family)
MKTIRFLAFTASLLLAMAFILSCGSHDNDKDTRTQVCSGVEYDADQFACFRGELVPLDDGKSSSSSPMPSSSSLILSSSSDDSSSSSSVCTDNSYGAGSPFTYEGQTYSTIKIGCQVWMAENLNYDVEGSKCYDNLESNCNTYGRLYRWATAMDFPASCNSALCALQINAKHRGVCPVGWHIPSAFDWDILTNYVQIDNGSTYTSDSHTSIAGKYLKATSCWNDYEGQSGNGEDKYGFAALPGGGGYSEGSFDSFDHVGNIGSWWSTSEGDRTMALNWAMFHGEESMSMGSANYKYFSFSIRCLQD